MAWPQSGCVEKSISHSSRGSEEGELAAIREIADRLDGKPAQMLDRRDVPITELTRAELLAIASGAWVVDGDDDVLLLPPAQQSESQRR